MKAWERKQTEKTKFGYVGLSKWRWLCSDYEDLEAKNKRYKEALEAFKNMPLVDDEKVNLIIMGVREVAKEALEG